AALDGEWTSGGSNFPSGNGAAGGDFRFRLNVLAGDVDRNGVVNSIDQLQERQRRLRSIDDPGSGRSAYDFRYDVDGDGRLSDVDAYIIRANNSLALPRAEPEGLAAASALANPLPPALAAAMAKRSGRVEASSVT